MKIENFNKEYKKGNVLLFFQGPDCGLCNGMKELALKELKDFDGKFISVNLKDFPKLRGEFQVFSFPTLLYLRDGIEVERVAGFFDLDKLKRSFKS